MGLGDERLGLLDRAVAGLDVAAGADVVLACRTRTKAEAARAEIVQRTAAGSVELLDLDLGSLAQIADAAAETNERFDRLDILVNNAGVMVPPYTKTADGFELQFGTNHLGHFAYTAQVFGLLDRTPASRIVTVSSIGHRAGRMRWDDLQWEQSYNRMGAYGMSKLANLLFTFELDRRLRVADKHDDTAALAAHPGMSATELSRYIPGAELPVLGKVFSAVTAAVGQTSAEGALPSLRAATDPAAESGQYYGSSKRFEIAGPPEVVDARPHAYDPRDQTRLWDVSQDLTGIEFEVTA